MAESLITKAVMDTTATDDDISCIRFALWLSSF